MLIDPQQFEPCFCRWMGQWLGSTDQPSCIARDGKTVRHSFDRKCEHLPLHVVSAWAGEHRLVLGQVAVDSTSNEITAIPDLLAGLALSGSLVTIDAAGCQKGIAQAIVKQHADDVLALKANQQRSFQVVQLWFEEQAFSVPARLKPVFDACDESHGRLIRRRVFVGAAPTELYVLGAWPGSQSIIAARSIHQVKPDGDISTAKRFSISSTSPEDSRLASAIRQHWSIENSLRWVLDVTFHEDASRVRERNACQNLALLKKNSLESPANQCYQRQSTRKAKASCLE